MLYFSSSWTKYDITHVTYWILLLHPCLSGTMIDYVCTQPTLVDYLLADAYLNTHYLLSFVYIFFYLFESVLFFKPYINAVGNVFCDDLDESHKPKLVGLLIKFCYTTSVAGALTLISSISKFQWLRVGGGNMPRNLAIHQKNSSRRRLLANINMQIMQVSKYPQKLDFQMFYDAANVLHTFLRPWGYTW